MTLIAPQPPRRKLAPAEARAVIGRTGAVTFNGLAFHVRIKDTKTAYGHVRFLVTPVAGSGQVWVGNVEL
jgi:hypothetical protein